MHNNNTCRLTILNVSCEPCFDLFTVLKENYTIKMVMPALKQEKYDFSHNHKGQKKKM